MIIWLLGLIIKLKKVIVWFVLFGMKLFLKISVIGFYVISCVKLGFEIIE